MPPLPLEYARVVREAVGDLGLKICLEPGRMIVANAGILVSRVIYAKQRPRQDLHHRRCRHERS
jgi:diaminopimelate decarboxylase